MLGLINHLISCLTLPFFILSAISVLGICLLKRKYAVSICVFLFFTTLWRLLFTISSSRNYSFYLICAFVAIAFAAKRVASKKHSHYALITVLFVILFFHFNKLNGSFKNTYIADIRDCTSTFLHDGHTVLFVDAKDFNRIRNTDLFPQKQYGFLEVTLPYHNLLAMYTKYDFRENDACFILSEKAGTHFDAPILSFFRENNIKFQKIQQYRTNTSKTRFYSVYYLEHFKPPVTIDGDKAACIEHLKDVFRASEQKDNPEIRDIIEKGTLKVYNPLFDVYVIQYRKQLFWFIGTKVDNDTEFIYQLHTSRPDLLPAHRIQHGFDNLGFRIGGGSELQKTGNYRIFVKGIPESYPVNYVSVGFNTAGNVTWFDLFQVDPAL